MTMLYLGTGGDREQVSALCEASKTDPNPGGLISFWYLPNLKRSGRFEDWSKGRRFLDSGAFTAAKNKKPIDVDALIAEILTGRWTEAATLDVIGDPVASVLNTERIAARFPDIIPVFHYGEPWEFLTEYATRYRKVGLGGIVPVKSLPDRLAWLDQCFSRVWPKKTHLFGCISEDVLDRFPIHSADSTRWCSPQIFGTANAFGGQKLGLNRPKMRTAAGLGYLLPEIAHFRRMQARLAARWAGEFKKQGWV